MRTKSRINVALIAFRRARTHRGRCCGSVKIDWRPKRSDPHVGSVDQPVTVAQPGKSATAPTISPGVLDPESLPVVAHDRKCMSPDDIGGVFYVLVAGPHA